MFAHLRASSLPGMDLPSTPPQKHQNLDRRLSSCGLGPLYLPQGQQHSVAHFVSSPPEQCTSSTPWTSDKDFDPQYLQGRSR